MHVVKNGHTILLGEEDLEVRSYLETLLKREGYGVAVAHDAEEVLSYLRSGPIPVSAVLLDVMMPRQNGPDALKEIRAFDRVTPVILISDVSPFDVAEAMNNGASGFIEKPIRPEELHKALKMVLDDGQLAASKPSVPASPPQRTPVFFGASPQMRKLQKLIDQIGWSDAPVLIQGETGVGKEVLAREVHAHSPRAKKSLLKLNCAALPSELVESELFGYERGAFTGAFQRKPGMFELADGGTLLLDEIGDMDYRLQAKLLQVLQDQEFQRLGGRDTVRVDVRIIAASHRDLEKAIAENAFRADLYYRLNVISVCVPPLRERKEDIIPIAELLIRKHSALGAPAVQLPQRLADAFLNYHWPGNVRELENTVRKFLIFLDEESVELELRRKSNQTPIAPVAAMSPIAARDEVPQAQPDIPAAPAIVSPEIQPCGPHLASGTGGSTPVLKQLAKANQEAQRTAILAALKATNWNRRQSAVSLHIEYKALLYKMKVLSIRKERPAPVQPRAQAAPMRRAAVVAISV